MWFLFCGMPSRGNKEDLMKKKRYKIVRDGTGDEQIVEDEIEKKEK